MPRNRPELGEQRKQLLIVLARQGGGQQADTLARLAGSTPVRIRQQLNRLEKDGIVERDLRGNWKLVE